MKQWRHGDITDPTRAIKTLENYRWSSYQDYNNINNFPSVIHADLLSETMGTSTTQRINIEKIISDPHIALHANKFET